MWVITALLIKTCFSQHFIQIKIKDFIGEDKVLSESLKERLGDVSTQLVLAKMPKQYQSNVRVHEHFKRSLLPNSRRQFKDPDNVAIKDRVLELMQHNIYVTQYRMQHLKAIIDAYATDVRFRVAYIFCRLDTLIREMRIMYTVVNKTLEKMKVHQHLIYYTYFLKKNIDVTYIVEHMINIHTNFMAVKSVIQNPYEYKPSTGVSEAGNPPPPGRPPVESQLTISPRPGGPEGLSGSGNPDALDGSEGNTNPVGPNGVQDSKDPEPSGAAGPSEGNEEQVGVHGPLGN